MLPRLEAAIGELRDQGRRSAAPSRMDWTGRYNVLSAFRILETLERRHLRQAEAALVAS